MKSLGICLGSSTITAVLTEKKDSEKPTIIKTIIKPHESNSKGTFKEILLSLIAEKPDKISITGRKLKDFVSLTTLSEPEAIEYALSYIDIPESVDALVSAGGETILVYELDNNKKITNVYTGNKCASGTGEFFIQQLGRMDLTIQDAMNIADIDEPHTISGRCSVFCKSDCTHALNRGEKKGRVVAGLCQMMSGKISELLVDLKEKRIILTGGISNIPVIMDYLRKDVNYLYIPKEARYFEALGAALWGFDKETLPYKGAEKLFKKGLSSFEFLNPLSKYEHLVTFKKTAKTIPETGKKYYLGLDVGSTTTKAVIIDEENKIAAEAYLRTNGDPIQASKNCYKKILQDIGNAKINIVALGVTGSGRKIAGLHAMTNSIINEIIAHATAAIYYDSNVDTIFEIGGQDAKYTYITGGIPSDYSMNEACSAGTGSFLEEAAYETLGIKMEDIAEIAFRGQKPPNFNDQCAAFISSDISTAFGEGIPRDDIVAGLVYSICMNYNNRVRGNRPYGKKVLMQGGVCYNRAVPVAMAALLEEQIIVPPNPGLMGAFGVALEVKNRIKANLLEEKIFDLNTLVKREVIYGKTFICAGGKEKCDRKCEIKLIKIEGKNIPFGGACNKYYNEIHNLNIDTAKFDLVSIREKMLFEKYIDPVKFDHSKKTIGLNKSFYINSYYPFFHTFFTSIGFNVVLSEKALQKGIDKKKSSYCYPAQLAHGFFQDLLNKKPDYIFLPHFLHIPVQGSYENNKACVFMQGEPFYLNIAFKRDIKKIKVFSPMINLEEGIHKLKGPMLKLASELGIKKKIALSAFKKGLEKMYSYYAEATKIGEKTLSDLRKEPNRFGVILFGRPYNAYVKEANMGIPNKFASRGITIIPADFINYGKEEVSHYMHWGIGKILLKTASLVKKDPQLFGVYITNFSCGPDSFLVQYFRDIMGKKPSLTLELDSHTADAGLNTRIEAAIDIIKYYRKLIETNKLVNEEKNDFVAADIIGKNYSTRVIASDGKQYKLTDKNVTFLFPYINYFGCKLGAAGLRAAGFNAVMAPVPGMEELKLGRANTTCKECLPLTIIAGSLLTYVKKYQRDDEIVVYFMPTDTSPCRLEMYNVSLKKIIIKNKLKNVAVLSLTDTDGYAGMGIGNLMTVWNGFVLAEILEEIRTGVMVQSKDPIEAMKIFDAEFEKLVDNFEKKENISMKKRLQLFNKALNKIPLKFTKENVPQVTLTGENYVRNEKFSRREIESTLATMGLKTKITPMIEYMYYADYSLLKGLSDYKLNIFERIYIFMKYKFQHLGEKSIKKYFKNNNFYEYDIIDVDKVLNASKKLVSPFLRGEVALATGVTFKEIMNNSSGIITIGPFGCMAARVAEGLLTPEMTVEGKKKYYPISVLGKNLNKLDDKLTLPYLSVEADGNPYPPIVQARLEVFGLQVKRAFSLIQKYRNEKK